VTSVDEALALIDAAFSDDPRPGNDALLNEQCSDDMDLAGLYEFPNWKDVPDHVIEREYAALSFLSPNGLRHFLPAYMSFSLRHPDGGAAAVGSTIFTLTPANDGVFRVQRWSTFTREQRWAVAAFLEAIVPYDKDAGEALDGWRSPAP
jgi:hypothetical protein